MITLSAWLGATIWGPPKWYPRPIPATALDGTELWGPDGHVILQHTLAQYNREMIPFEIFFTIILVCGIWLLGRFCKYLYEKRKNGADAAEGLSPTQASTDRM